MLPETNHVIWAVAEVVREETNDLADGVALRFVRITESDRERIRKYVAQSRPATESQAA